MKIKKTSVQFLLIVCVLAMTLGVGACVPQVAQDESVIGIVPDNIEHKDYDNYGGFIYGNEEESYNLMFRLGLPENYIPAKRYPLVIFLHWLDAQGVDNEKQMLPEFIEGVKKAGEDCIVFVPQLAHDSMAFSPHFYDKKNCSSLYNACLDAVLNKYRVDTDRIYITGVSMGAHNIWEQLALYPTKYAAAMPVSFGGRTESAESLKRIPIFAAHSKDDSVVDFSTTYDMVEALKAAGGTVRFNAYESGNHAAFREFYGDESVWKWLFMQSNSYKG